MHFHHFKINERMRNDGPSRYRHYMRRFLQVYDDNDKTIFEGHIETISQKKNIVPLSIRLSIGNEGSETPWDGHFLLFGTGVYWGHTAFRKLAAWLTRCSGYKWDNRKFLLRIRDSTLYWEFADHSDMCRKDMKLKRRGSMNLSLMTALFGPKRYSWDDVDSYPTTIRMPEGDYAVVLKLQRTYFGRTKLDRNHHVKGWSIDIEAPKGIPTHVDHSGGWKGDRTYGFGLDITLEDPTDWREQAEEAVTKWVLGERLRTGFVAPDPVDNN